MPETISLQEFERDDFNSEDYVKRLVKERVAGSELSDYKKQLQGKKEKISTNLKKKVFENYTQFIETAREISRKLLTLLTILEKSLKTNYYRSGIGNVSAVAHPSGST